MSETPPMTPDTVFALFVLIFTFISAVIVGLLRLYDVISNVINGWKERRQTVSYATSSSGTGNGHSTCYSRPVVTMPTFSPSAPPISYLEPEQRLHTILAGRSGDGKTQASISMMVADIVRGCQVFWLSPDLALYHPKDQPTDLRPLHNHFSFHADIESIARVLAAIVETVNQRQALYTQGKDVGHPICLYIDEWPAIVAEAEKVEAMLGTILRRGRRANVWIILATQDAQVETMKLHGGLRSAFQTRLVGNVDRTTWLSLIGKEEKQIPVQKGFWYAAGQMEGLVRVERPPVHSIAKIARMQPGQFTNIAAPTENVIDFPQPVASNGWTEAHIRVAKWLTETPDISTREVARRLYPGTDGGGGYSTQTAKIIERVREVIEYDCSTVKQETIA